MNQEKTYLHQWFETINPENVIEELKKLNKIDDVDIQISNILMDAFWLSKEGRGLKFECEYNGKIEHGFFRNFSFNQVWDLDIKFPGKYSAVYYRWDQIKFIEFVE